MNCLGEKGFYPAINPQFITLLAFSLFVMTMQSYNIIKTTYDRHAFI